MLHSEGRLAETLRESEHESRWRFRVEYSKPSLCSFSFTSVVDIPDLDFEGDEQSRAR